MTQEDKWNSFIKNGSVQAYLSYAAARQSTLESENRHEAADTRVDYQGEQRGGE